MTDVTIETLPPAPLHRLELWGDPVPTAARLAKTLGHPLPAAGRAQGDLLRCGPTTWMVEDDVSALEATLGDGGALTPIGGGFIRVRLSGPAWRSLLMEGGLFDFESPAFGPDSVTTTLVEHVTLTVRVIDSDSCLVYVPTSHSADLLHFWQVSAATLPRS